MRVQGNTIQYGSEDFLRMEEAGLGVSHQVGFVLVAGGLGERLGYNGIKISLSPEITTGRCYIQLYIESILALQREASRRTGTDVVIPFAIMTSGDTHARTAKLLADSSNFGMVADQITLLQQEKVASLADEDAHLVADKEDPYKLETKPHGYVGGGRALRSTRTTRRAAPRQPLSSPPLPTYILRARFI